MGFWILIFVLIVSAVLAMYRRGHIEQSKYLKGLAIGTLVLGIFMVLAALYEYCQGLEV